MEPEALSSLALGPAVLTPSRSNGLHNILQAGTHVHDLLKSGACKAWMINTPLLDRPSGGKYAC